MDRVDQVRHRKPSEGHRRTTLEDRLDRNKGDSVDRRRYRCSREDMGSKARRRISMDGLVL